MKKIDNQLKHKMEKVGFQIYLKKYNKYLITWKNEGVSIKIEI